MPVASRLKLLLLCQLALILCACSEEPILHIGSNRWPGYEPVYLARDLAAFNRNEINLVELPSTTDVMQFLRNGYLEGGMLTLDEAITLIADAVPLRIVLVMDISHGADTLLVQPGIKGFDDLKGKRVGVELSALGALMLESVLEVAGLDKQQIQVVPLTADQQEDAFRNGKVDAVITFEPIRSHLLAHDAVEIFNSSQIPGRIIDVLAVREEVTQSHPGQLKKLLAGYFAARHFTSREPTAAVAKMSLRQGVDAATLQTAFTGLVFPDIQENHAWLGMGGTKLIDTATKLTILMAQHKLIAQIPDLSGLADDRFLPRDEP